MTKNGQKSQNQPHHVNFLRKLVYVVIKTEKNFFEFDQPDLFPSYRPRVLRENIHFLSHGKGPGQSASVLTAVSGSLGRV